ncbi:hypothetical protein CEXT_329231 [Caerostris extrusa]|uniref:Uncharacterized protein n=1 Tax=Caerostris extrusa TaxID=172846 RepID=A0AAV4U7V2_CAEEX|nr:hypothetical protein CEXT_329231 [Caerostris extrusa]
MLGLSFLHGACTNSGYCISFNFGRYKWQRLDEAAECCCCCHEGAPDIRSAEGFTRQLRLAGGFRDIRVIKLNILVFLLKLIPGMLLTR